MHVTASRQCTAGASGFGTVSGSHGSTTGPPQLAGLFSGGMPQLRSRGGTAGARSDSGGSSTIPRPGQRRHVIHIITVKSVYNKSHSKSLRRDLAARCLQI